MSTAAPEAPAIIPEHAVVSGEATSPADQSFKDIFNTPENTPVREIKPKEQPKKAPETKQEASKEDLKGKTADKGSDAPGKGSKKWEKLGELKAPETKAEPEAEQEEAKGESSQSTEEEEKMPEGKNGQSRWMQLKAVENTAKKAETIDDILKIPALSDKAKESIASLKKELDAYKTNGHIPEEVQKRIDRLETRYANELLDEKPEFQQEVLIPIQKAWSELGDIAKEAGLDQVSGQALFNAVREMSGVSRSLAIRRIIAKGRMSEKNEESGETEEVPLPDETVATLSQLAIEHSNKLHSELWPKEVAYRQQAKDVAAASHGKELEETESQRQAKEKQFSDEAKRLSVFFKEKMPLVFDQHPDALEAIISARPSTELADQVFDAQSGHVVNFLAKTLNSTLQELEKAKASLKAREASKPRGGDGSPPAPKKQDGQISWEEAFGRK